MAIHGSETDLHRAIQKGDLVAVRAWIAAGKSLEGRDPTAMTPLALAAYFNRPDIFHELLEAGAAIEPTDDGNHLLFYAAWRGNRKLVQTLLERGVDIDFRGGTSQTALIGAAKGGHLGIVKLLVDRYADLFPKDYQGHTALDLAEENGHAEIIKYLKAAKAPGQRVSKKPAKPHPGEKLVESARTIVRRFSELAAKPKYQAFIARLAKATGRKPKAFKNPDAFEFPKLKGVFAVEFAAKPDDDQRALVAELGRAALVAGATLVESDPMREPSNGLSCVLYPTTNKLAVIVARETSSNGTIGADREDIAAFIADLDKVNPFRLAACSGDSIVGTFDGPVRKAKTVAKRLLELCSEGDDTVEGIAASLKSDRSFFLWWD